VHCLRVASVNVLYSILVIKLESIRWPRCCGSSWLCSLLQRM